ncbi:hypothetical protein ABZ905_31620 [Streptomyces parvus]|uniref:hypothetical protein n=1 Tax=Streptomyces parvus TaxID=66428 RepID=UPI0033D9B02C
MTERTQDIQLIEEDLDTDCLVWQNTETGVMAIFLRPGQSFDNAVKSVQRVCPELSLTHIQALIRTNCPNIVEMNERLGVDQQLPRFEAAPDAGVIPPAPVKPSGGHRRPRPPRWARIAAVAAPALVGGVVIANMFGSSGKPLATPAASPSLSQDDKIAASTYKDPAFKKIAEGGAMTCDTMGAYEAKCVDQDGKVMSSEASVGTSTAFTFSYDFEKVGFRLFPDIESATAWSAEEANKHLYKNVRQHGRVVLWGTDAERIREWEKPFLEEERRKAERDGVQDMALSGLPQAATPLPARLANLAFGTLGVTEASVARAVHADDPQSVQLLQAVQLVMGNADLSQLGVVPAGPGDAVAVVLDATNEPTAMTDSSKIVLAVGSETLPPPVVVPTRRPVSVVPDLPAPTAPVQKPAETPQPQPPAPDPVLEPENPKAETPKTGNEGSTPPVVVPEPVPVPEEPPAEPAPDPVPTPEEPAEPAPVPEEPPAEPAPAEETPETPQADGAEVPPDTTTALPEQEEPDAGLGMGALPTAWAA